MPAQYYEIRLCSSCGLRYPLVEDHPFGTRCPSCLGETECVRREQHGHESPNIRDKRSKGSGLGVLLDNIRSAWNVGAIFRTADGLGASKLYLCGITPTPENDSVRKISLGAEESLAWEYFRDGRRTAMKLKAEGCGLIALEQDVRAVSLENSQIVDSQTPVLILGNEVTGVDPDVLDLCDQIVHIPMAGQKNSFNVEVAFGIAAYQLLYGKP